MLTVGDFYKAMDDIAPFNITGDWDNVGLLIGSCSDSVSKVLLALDATKAVIEEAVEIGADLIITHHAVIFDPLHTIPTDSNPYRLISNNIGLIAAHTNLDMTPGGVNTVFAEIIGVNASVVISPSEIYPEEYGYASMGTLSEPTTAKELAKKLKIELNAPGVRYLSTTKPIETVAYCGGSGKSFLEAAIAAGADAYVTGELDHNHLLRAQDENMALILAGHFHTETIVMEPLKAMLKERIPTAEIIVSSRCTDGIKFI